MLTNLEIATIIWVKAFRSKFGAYYDKPYLKIKFFFKIIENKSISFKFN